MSSNIKITIDDENFLKDFLKDFYHKIIETNNFNNFEKISTEWIKKYILKNDDNNKNPEKILELMENHKQSKFWFSSFIGFFNQFGIGCNLNREKALELYLFTINNDDSFLIHDFKKLNLIDDDDDDNSFNLLKNMNIIIGKYL